MRPDNLSTYGQTKPRSSGARFGLAALNEFIKYGVKFRFRDAGTFVGNAATKRLGAIWQAIIREDDSYFLPTIREFYCI